MPEAGGFGVERLLFNLSALADLGEEVTSSNEFERVVRSSLYLVMGTFSVSKGIILRYNPDKKELYPVVSKGLGDVRDMRINIGDEAVRQMVIINKPFSINNRPFDIDAWDDSFLEKIKADLIVPIVARGELHGALILGKRLSEEEYTKNDNNILSMMCRQIALSLHSHTLLQRLNQKGEEGMKESLIQIYYGTIHALAAAIDAKDAYTKGHSHRVSAYCAAMAEELGWSKKNIEGLRVAGLLHDLGKIAVEKSIINKTGSLTSEETVELNRHPVIGYEILSRAKFPWEEIPALVRNHHEKVNGKGYPDGLKGEDIPKGSRIMALADAFDAMTTDRPYRKRLSLEKTLMEINENIGTQFDSEIANSLFSVLRKEVGSQVEMPTILPYLQGNIDAMKVGSLLNGLTGHA